MGYKVEQFVKSVDENLFCSICQEVFQDPLSCKDGHTFCSDCITRWLRTSNKCPLDNTRITVADLARNSSVNGIVGNLEIYCQFSDNEEGENKSKVCTWTGKLQDLQSHEETCPTQQVHCSNKRCPEIMHKKKIDDHVKICEYNTVVCECRLVLYRFGFKKHKEDNCPETLVPCPYKCTNSQGEIMKLKRKDFEHHVMKDCSKVKVVCPFEGCRKALYQMDLNDHLEKNLYSHMLSLAKQNTQLKDELNQVKEHLSTLKDELSSSYIWTMHNYGSLSKEHPSGSWFRSPRFWLCGCNWYLKMYPNGENTKAEGFLSVFLCLRNFDDKYYPSSAIVPNGEVTVSFRLSVMSQEPDVDDFSSSLLVCTYKTKGCMIGYSKFMEAADVKKYCNSTNDSLTIKCTIYPGDPQ